MSEPIERAADAIRKKWFDHNAKTYEEKWQELARAVIEAIREPTPEMIKLGQEAIDKGMSASYVWRLLIEIVLK